MSALPFVLGLTCCWLPCLALLVGSGYALPEASRKPRLARGADDADDAGPSALGRSIYGDRPDEPDDLDELFPDREDEGGGGVRDDPDDRDDEDEDSLEGNATEEKGRYLGSRCDLSCNPELRHVFCDVTSGTCECEKFYPVRLGPTKGCAKPRKLGEQCFYRATCSFVDRHSTCTQVRHNAVCDCEEGYHRVALSRPSKKIFCAEDLVLITTDVPTLLGVATGLAVLTGLICFVLKLFSRARYARPRHYANANHAPLFSSDTGIPLTLHGARPSSRSSERSAGPLTCALSRRPSVAGSRGPLVPASRAGSRRPSLVSIHSSTSSARSYSARRLERERNEKEQRQALQELRLAKQREQQEQQNQQQQSQGAPTPSPRTPHSTDELLPSVQEGKELFYNEQEHATSSSSEMAAMSTSAIVASNPTASTSTTSTTKTAVVPSGAAAMSVGERNAAPRVSSDIFQM